MRRSARRRAKDRLGYLLLALLLLAGVGAAFGVRAALPARLDPETLCPARMRAEAARTAFVIDATDALAPRHKRRLKAAGRAVLYEMQRGDRVLVVRLSAADPREPDILFSKCSPGRSDEANPLFENPRRVQTRWDDEFAQAFEAALARAASARQGNETPLTEAIAALAREPDFADRAGARTLLLASDLMEHRQAGFSLYDERADFAQFEKSGAEIADLTGTIVRVIVFDREGGDARQARAKEAFWSPYFEAAQAKSVAWR